MCDNNFVQGGIYFPSFTRYACCNPCCDESVLAETVSPQNNNNCSCNCCCGCCRCCCNCCCGNVGGSNTGCGCDSVGGTSDSNRPCPCRGGW